jgi:hypothetical protein
MQENVRGKVKSVEPRAAGNNYLKIGIKSKSMKDSLLWRRKTEEQESQSYVFPPVVRLKAVDSLPGVSD